MAINFPSNPTNAQEVTEGNVTYVYNATKGYWESSEVSSGASIDVLADMAALIAKTGMSNGDQAFVTGNNNLYIYSGSGWYKVATVQNDAPSAITGVNGTYELAIDGTATTITAVSTDPEGFPLTWSYSTSGLGSIATVSHSDGVFTITPSTTEADAGTFTLTINATDGVNGAVSTSTSLTLEFIVIVANSKYTTLLATAVDTSDNNNITDTSTNNHSITVNGDAHAGSFSPYRSGGYSMYFGGGDYLRTPTINLSGDFTIQFFVNLNAITTDVGIFSFGTLTSTNSILELYNNTSGQFRLYSSSGGELGASSAAEANKWYHVAITRSGNTFKAYLDGVEFADDTTARTINSAITIGGYVNTSYLMNGHIRDFRITTNVEYPSNNFTPPSEPLTAITGTVLLTCHLPYIADGSTNDHSITVNNNVSTKPFSPYDYLEYSATDHGGSVYFDGTGDYLLINSPPTLGANDWTFETWYYSASAPLVDYNVLLSQGQGNNTIVSNFSVSSTGEIWIQTYTTTNVVLYNTAAGTIKGGMWNHIVLTHDYDGSNGGTYKIYANGNQVGNVSYTSGYYWNSGGISGTPLAMAQYRYNTQANSACYFSDWKISNSVTYSSNFTPPTAPLSSSGTSLHIKGTDASIIDKSQGNNLKLVGNTTGSTTQVKFADTKSMYFDGTGDVIQFDTISLPGDFTIEYWLKLSTYNDDAGIFGDTGATNAQQRINHNGTFGKIMLYDAGYIHQTTNCFTQSEAQDWMHIAYSRQGNSFTLYVNGILKDTVSTTQVISVNIFGAGGYNNGNDHLDGYIQDFRITRGLARYTANFTPPTAPLEG